MPRSLTFVFLLLLNTAFSQNEMQSTLFWNNSMHFNPAMTGLQYKRAANVQWRNQWTQVNGAPTTLWANYAQKIDKIHGAAGISYDYTYIGFNKEHTALATYAFHLPVKNAILSFGTSLGVFTMTPNFKWIPPNTLDDSSLPDYRLTKVRSDLGVALHHEKWNVGISLTQLNNLKFFNNNDGYASVAHFNADYSFSIDSNWTITPLFHIYTDWIKAASDISILTRCKNLWFGGSLHNIEQGSRSYGGMLGYDFKGKFRVGYCLEYSDFQVSDKPNLTHEVVLSFLVR